MGDPLASPPPSACVAFSPCLLICGIKDRVERVVPPLLSFNPSNLLGTHLDPFTSLTPPFFPLPSAHTCSAEGNRAESEN